MKYDPMLYSKPIEANQCQLPFTNEMVSIYTLVMVVTMNTTTFQRPAFTNTLNNELCHVCVPARKILYIKISMVI